MPRRIDPRRSVRRAVVLVCALFALSILPFLAIRSSEIALAQSRTASHRSFAFSKQSESSVEHPAPKPKLPENRQFLSTRTGTRVLAYPPLPSADTREQGAPLVIMLHGMCGDPLSTCDFWSHAGREGSFLICPEGNASCGGARDWKGDGEMKATAIDESLAAVEEAYGAHIAHGKGDILIGFSRGAFVARDVAYARPGRFKAIVFIGANMIPDAARLKASGVRRVVMAAGDHDGARPTMQRAAAILSAAGLPTRYMSLGPIYHALPADLDRILTEALQWLREADPAQPQAEGNAS
jgi:predicted esterase